MLACAGSSEPAKDSPSETDGAVRLGGSVHEDEARDDDAMEDARADADERGPERVCMGSRDYCERPYNQVAQVCTHNAMSSVAYAFELPTPNQQHSLTRQLDDGVRCLMLDTYEHQGEPYLCHGACGFWGEYRLHDGLVEIADWLASNPDEVVTFILQSNVSQPRLYESMVGAGLADVSGEPSPETPLYFHDGPPGTPWPTLGTMLENNQRLVVFTDDSGADAPWHLDWTVFGWETPYGDPEFPCTHGRGDPEAYDHQVFILNHYSLCEYGGCEEKGAEHNAYGVVFEHGRACWQVSEEDNPWGQIPTFVNVDHYHIPTEGGPGLRADVFEAVDALNALWPGPPEP